MSMTPKEPTEEGWEEIRPLMALCGLVFLLLAASSFAEEGTSPEIGASSEIPTLPDTAPLAPDEATANPLDPGPATTSLAPDPSLVPSPEEEASPPPSVASEGGGTIAPSRSKKSRVAPYKLDRPNFGLALAGSPMVGVAAAPFSDVQSRGMQLLVEYQPAFLQTIGVLGIGLNAGLFVGNNASISTLANQWSVGGQARYQLRFLREQWVVPTVGFGAEYLSYNFGEGQAGSLLMTYPSFGGMLLLNIFEPEAAAENYVANGVSRSYVFGEARLQNGSGTGVSVSGLAVYCGIRVEL